jgi:hypothetical protein
MIHRTLVKTSVVIAAATWTLAGLLASETSPEMIALAEYAKAVDDPQRLLGKCGVAAFGSWNAHE